MHDDHARSHNMQTCSEPTCATPQQPLAQQRRGPRIRGRSMRSAPHRDPNSLSPPGRQPRCVRTPQAHCPATQSRALSLPMGQTHPLPSFASPLPMASAPRGLLRDSAAPWVSPALQGLPASLTRASPLLEASPLSQDHAEPCTESIPSFSPAFHPGQPRPGSLLLFSTRRPLL